MKDFIDIPVFLTEDINTIKISPMACTTCETCQTIYQQCGSCEVGCLDCQGGCQTTCQASCQSSCERGCQNYCETCQSRCQEDCQSSCEINCQSSCQNNCQLVCQIACQSDQIPKLSTPTLNTNATTKTADSISITINPVSGATTYTARITGISELSQSTRVFTFTGLNPNTQYYIQIKCSGSGYQDSDWAGYYATTLPTQPWEWHNPKTSGTGFNVTRTEWIAFCNKINEARLSKGLSSYSFTTSTDYIDKDKGFHAWIFLQAANAINALGTGVASQVLNVKSNDDIYAWYFENLKVALNNAIG